MRLVSAIATQLPAGIPHEIEGSRGGQPQVKRRKERIPGTERQGKGVGGLLAGNASLPKPRQYWRDRQKKTQPIRVGFLNWWEEDYRINRQKDHQIYDFKNTNTTVAPRVAPMRYASYQRNAGDGGLPQAVNRRHRLEIKTTVIPGCPQKPGVSLWTT